CAQTRAGATPSASTTSRPLPGRTPQAPRPRAKICYTAPGTPPPPAAPRTAPDGAAPPMIVSAREGRRPRGCGRRPRAGTSVGSADGALLGECAIDEVAVGVGHHALVAVSDVEAVAHPLHLKGDRARYLVGEGGRQVELLGRAGGQDRR